MDELKSVVRKVKTNGLVIIAQILVAAENVLTDVPRDCFVCSRQRQREHMSGARPARVRMARMARLTCQFCEFGGNRCDEGWQRVCAYSRLPEAYQ